MKQGDVGKIRPTIYFCEICGKEFRAKKGERGEGSAKAQAVECSLLPTRPFKFRLSSQVEFKTARTKAKASGKRPKFSKLVKVPIFAVLKHAYERRGKNHVNRYLLGREGSPNSPKRWADEYQLLEVENGPD